MIRDLPTGERPRERLRDQGPGALSNADLLAVLLRTGRANESVVSLATRLLAQHGGLAGLGRVSFTELCQLPGVGEAKACQVLAGLELGKRLASLSPEDRPIVRVPEDVFHLLRAELALLDQESLRVVLLNTKNQVMGIPEVYRGNVSAAILRPAEVLREAVRGNYPSVIVVHNHPSGDPTPSPDDVAVTSRLVEAGRALDIGVLDHIVVGQQGFVSMKAKGLGFR
ncbi:MAG: DNA repair protein RadC [Chloroflexi bacterium]|nr:DNA repair protein RadC [Chloroflexota bacterium]